MSVPVKKDLTILQGKTFKLPILCSSKFAQAAPPCAAFCPVECHADEVVAKRLGVGVCK